MRSRVPLVLMALLVGCEPPAERPKELRVEEKSSPVRRKSSRERIAKLDFSPDGKFLLGSYASEINREVPEEPRSLTLWETETGKALWTKGGKELRIGMFVFAPDGKQVLVKSGDKVEVWAIPSGEVVRTFLEDAREVWNMAFFPDGKRVLMAMTDGRLCLLEFANGKERSILEGSLGLSVCLAVSSSGKLALACSRATAPNDSEVRLWNAETGALIHAFPAKEGWFRLACFGPDDTLAVVNRFPAGANGAELVLVELPICRELRAFAVEAAAVAFSRDGKRLVTAVRDGKLARWDLDSGKNVWEVRMDTEWVSAVAISGDGRLAACAAGEDVDGRRGQIRVTLWDAVNGKRLRALAGPTSDN
jgi:WD40 repeat protein